MLEMVSRIKATQRRAARITPRRPPPKRHGLSARLRWLETARPNQLLPEGEWLTWLILAGRGFGKTRTGAETIADWARNTPQGRFALVAQTAADGRDVMVEGESGLLSVLDESELRGGSVELAWNRSLGELFLKNGARFKIYSSEKPRKLRGPQHHGAWGDEPATWNDADKGTGEDTTYTNLLFGLRLGRDPRVVLTGTPRPVRLIRELRKEESTVLTGGKTTDNITNLSVTFRKNVISKYEGTRLGRQELDGELLEDTPGALWQYAMFNREGFRTTFEQLPDLVRIVVAIDPQASQSEDHAETGIVVAGRDAAGRAYILADLSGNYSPSEWATVALDAYKYYRADAIVPERNNGGDMVENTIRMIDKTANVITRPTLPGSGRRHAPGDRRHLHRQRAHHHHARRRGLPGRWVRRDLTRGRPSVPAHRRHAQCSIPTHGYPLVLGAQLAEQQRPAVPGQDLRLPLPLLAMTGGTRATRIFRRTRSVGGAVRGRHGPAGERPDHHPCPERSAVEQPTPQSLADGRARHPHRGVHQHLRGGHRPEAGPRHEQLHRRLAAGGGIAGPYLWDLVSSKQGIRSMLYMIGQSIAGPLGKGLVALAPPTTRKEGDDDGQSSTPPGPHN